MCLKMKFINFNFFDFIIINVKTLFNLEKEQWTFDKEKGLLKENQVGIIILNMQKEFWNIINLHQVLKNETL
jgi:hypothetical protein